MIPDSVDLLLRVPLEKEIPVAISPEDSKTDNGEEEFPEITEVIFNVDTESFAGLWEQAFQTVYYRWYKTVLNQYCFRLQLRIA